MYQYQQSRRERCLNKIKGTLFIILIIAWVLAFNKLSRTPVPTPDPTSVCRPVQLRPYPGFEGSPIQVIHIPRVGRSSLDEYLLPLVHSAGLEMYWYSSIGRPGDFEFTFNCLDDEWPSEPPPNLTSNVFSGHRGYGFCPRMNTSNLFTIVVFREPIKRFESTYYYLNTHPEYSQFPEGFFENKTLNDWISIAYSTEETHFLNGTISSFRIRNTFQYWMNSQYHFMSGYGNQTAVDNVRRSNIVVTTDTLEHLPTQLKAFTTLLDRVENATFPHKNTGNHTHPPLSNTSIAILNSWGGLDYQVWQEAVERELYLTELAQQPICNP